MTSFDALQNPQAAQGAQTTARQQEQIQQAIQDAQKAVEAATREAMAASQQAQAASADRELAQAQGDARPGNGIIVIPRDGDNPPVEIKVDGQGIHVSQSGNTTTIPIQDVIPKGAVQISFFLSAALVAVAIIGPLLRYFLRRAERRQSSVTISDAVQARLDAMERNIDTVAVELERVSEGQRFTNRLLEQRPLEHAQRIDR